MRAIGNDLYYGLLGGGPAHAPGGAHGTAATPGTILLTAATWRLVEGLVHVQALGAVPVKGLTAPVEAFRAGRGHSAAAALTGGGGAGGPDALCRAVPEFAALHQALVQAAARHGQVVALVGEAGVGKSRLAYEFMHAHPTQGWRILESASVSYGKATPYFPVLDLLKRYCYVEERDDPRTVRAKVTGQVLTLEATLQDIPCRRCCRPGGTARRQSVSAARPVVQRRQHTPSRPQACATTRKARCSRCCWCEDLHWIDAETQALLDSLVESLADGPTPAAGQLSPGVPAQLEQDLLHATAARPTATRQCRRVLAGPAGRRLPAWGRSNSS